MPLEQQPRLVIIVADGPLMVGTPAQLAGRDAIQMAVASPPLPPASIATTIATGVSPLIHGIVKKGTVDTDSLDIREAVRSDRRFQTFWDNTDLEVKLINWPAIIGDDRVTAYESNDEFEQAGTCLDAAIVGILFPRLAREKITPEQVHETQRELEQFLAKLSPQTHVVIVHRRTKADGSILKSIHTLGSTFLVEGCSYETKNYTYLEYIGGASYLLAGLPCPAGVNQPNWPFLSKFEKTGGGVFPITSTSDSVDWLDVIERLVKQGKKAGITLLTQRFTTFVSLAFKKQKWKELEYNSACLVQLQGTPFAYWMLILALDQQGKIEKLQSVAELLEEHYPNLFITNIAKCLVQFDAEVAQELLQSIDVEKLGVYHALGAYGRLCLKAGLEEQGIRALLLATQKGVMISSDRAQLANYYLAHEKYEDALKSLKQVGISSTGEISWQVLRLKILVALGRAEESLQQANTILAQNATHPVALEALKKFS